LRIVRSAIIAVLATSLFSPLQAEVEGFQLNTDKEGLRKFGNRPFFSELAVGEEAYVYVSNLCLEGDKLQLISNLEIGTMSEYGFNLKIKREVNNSVTGQIVVGTSADLSSKPGWFSAFGNLYQCEALSTLTPYEPAFLRILSIDGFTDLKSLMRSHFEK
jgi:hypothetical protein